MDKSLQYINVSYNKLRSLAGIECTVNLKFLNAEGNVINSLSGISLLQHLKEVILAHNQIS
jgi:Leucine-rich repeat (LRR) protein